MTVCGHLLGYHLAIITSDPHECLLLTILDRKKKTAWLCVLWLTPDLPHILAAQKHCFLFLASKFYNKLQLE
jgi:hypothetical protein